MKIVLLTMISLFFLMMVDGCSKEDTTLADTSHLGIPFFIKVQENKSFIPFNLNNKSSDSIFSLSFKKVNYDYRCPLSTCYLCYGSTAQIQVLLTHQNIQSTINLTIIGCQEEYECNDNLYYRKDTLGYRICLLRLDPYPTGTTVNFKNYTAKINISKL